MRKLSVTVGLAFLLLAARPAAAEFISYGWSQSDGYGVTFSVGDPYCPERYYPDPYAIAAPVYIPVPVVIYPPPPPPVVVYSPPVIYRSVIVHRPVVEKRVIVRQVVRQPVVVNRHVVREHVIVPKRHFERPGGHDRGLPPGLQRIQHRR